MEAKGNIDQSTWNRQRVQSPGSVPTTFSGGAQDLCVDYYGRTVQRMDDQGYTCRGPQITSYLARENFPSEKLLVQYGNEENGYSAHQAWSGDHLEGSFSHGPPRRISNPVLRGASNAASASMSQDSAPSAGISALDNVGRGMLGPGPARSPQPAVDCPAFQGPPGWTGRGPGQNQAGHHHETSSSAVHRLSQTQAGECCELGGFVPHFSPPQAAHQNAGPGSSAGRSLQQQGDALLCSAPRRHVRPQAPPPYSVSGAPMQRRPRTQATYQSQNAAQEHAQATSQSPGAMYAFPRQQGVQALGQNQGQGVMQSPSRQQRLQVTNPNDASRVKPARGRQGHSQATSTGENATRFLLRQQQDQAMRLDDRSRPWRPQVEATWGADAIFEDVDEPDVAQGRGDEPPLPLRLLASSRRGDVPPPHTLFEPTRSLDAGQFDARDQALSADEGELPHVQDRGPSFLERPGPMPFWLTTLLIRRLPARITQARLFLQWPPDGSFNFFFLPYSSKQRRTSRYAFINFVNAELAREFYLKWHRKVLGNDGDEENVLHISEAKLQGFWPNLKHFSLRDGNNFRDCGRNRVRDRHQPAVFNNGFRIDLPNCLAQMTRFQASQTPRWEGHLTTLTQRWEEWEAGTERSAGPSCPAHAPHAVTVEHL